MAATAEGNQLAEEQRRKMCQNKRRFRRENDALMFLIRCRQRGVFAAGRVYRCPVCGGHHVTSEAHKLAA